ncbi:PLP-dependent aminotransferase family protein [Roseovarius atlanticus]|uniref:MocR-like pyridoxine biosynthesis transcription factor PdxR n=1 Tax=Roseovarius atlanticus TaxID=1641875 RepID=UPI001C94E9B0|nr:PLP-dependent aminotransferase family protein [Roseovarius atlanticus]MBY5989140.1 PLP-dependent aminotransferase family protein [Roseovarius atlanticus]MBY6124532.1 PLP-dependent aminotransferase family protein [Roseovarius atlanticus]MBY6149027.1 PLP-dependent aminotransferase family protein [Roseovarius atlanticus]
MTRFVGLFSFLELDRSGKRTLAIQLFDSIREAILDGTLSPGTRLPSSRQLAKQLGISRNTVTTAYEQLCVEEYVTPVRGAGTKVAELPALQQIHPRKNEIGEPDPPRIRLSRRGENLSDSPRYLPQFKNRSFAAGLPALDLFPHELWARYISRAVRRSAIRRFDYGEISGTPELKRSIVEHLATARGFRPELEQIVILNGAQAALDLIARLTADVGDTAWLEEPGYLGARGAFRGAGLAVRPIAVDAQGLRPPDDLSQPPKLIYVTPSHHCPTGVPLSLDRRLKLLDVARRTNALVIEDDYDSEFRYAGPPISTLWSLNKGRSVIYMGTFSKTMLPGIKIGYLVAPPCLASAIANALHHTGQAASKTIQFALAEFIDDGRFSEHIRQMKKAYYSRRGTFLAELERCLGGAITYTPTSTGMQQTVFLKGGMSDVAISAAAMDRGIAAPVLSRFYIGPKKTNGLFLGFASSGENETRRGLEKLASAFEASQL